jgi:hypothetical protein
LASVVLRFQAQNVTFQSSGHPLGEGEVVLLSGGVPISGAGSAQEVLREIETDFGLRGSSVGWLRGRNGWVGGSTHGFTLLAASRHGK